MLKIKDNVDLKELEKFGYYRHIDLPTRYYTLACRKCLEVFKGEIK